MSDHTWKVGDRFSLLDRYTYKHYVIPVGQTGTIVRTELPDFLVKLDSGHTWSQDELWFPAHCLKYLPEVHEWKDGDRFTIPYQSWMGTAPSLDWKDGKHRLHGATGTLLKVPVNPQGYAKIKLDPGQWSIDSPSILLDNLQYLPKEKATMNDLQHNVWSYLQTDGHAERKTALKELAEGGFFTSEAAESAEEILEGWVTGWEREETFCIDGIARFRSEFFGPKYTGEVDVWLELGIRIPADKTATFREYGNGSAKGITIAEKIKALVREEFGIPAYQDCFYGETALYPNGTDIHVAEVEANTYFDVKPPRG